MENYIKECLGVDVLEKKYTLPKEFPMYLKNNYSYSLLTIHGVDCLFVKPKEFSLPIYKKHILKIGELSGLPVVLNFNRITPYQRNVLISNNIPFIVDESQIYMPFLAICLTEKYEKTVKIEKFSPITQLVFLYLFFYKHYVTVTDLSKILCYSSMSIHRAYLALVECGLYQYSVDGVKKYLEPTMPDDQLLKSAEPYMVNPITKTYHCMLENKEPSFLKSGLYALSSKTMLEIEENERCFAVCKHEVDHIYNVVSQEQAENQPTYLVQCWSYNPRFLTESDCVDDISLVLSLKNIEDERVQQAVDEIRSKYKW